MSFENLYQKPDEKVTVTTEQPRLFMGDKIEFILDEAKTTVLGPRQNTYGSPQSSFQQIANFWTSYLDRRALGPLTPQDVANMMILMKVSRSATGGYHQDSTIDIIGYAALKEVI